MLALNQFRVHGVVGASDKLISIIWMGFGDAELAQRGSILRFHNPHNFINLE